MLEEVSYSTIVQANGTKQEKYKFLLIRAV